MASRWAKKRSGWPSDPMAGPRMQNFWCRTVSTITSRKNSAFAARSCGLNGWRCSSATGAPIPSLPINASACSGAIFPRAGTKTSQSFPPMPTASPARDSSARVLNAIAPRLPWLLGGAADLAPSTKTRLTFEGAGDFEADDYGGRNFHFGIREHAMGSICNGLSLSKLRPFGSGFLIFSDYMKPPIRLGAIMELPVVYAFTHDSIGVGEDGPTHQPVEQLAALRSIPGLDRLASGRCQRGRRGVARRPRPQARAGLLDPEPTEPADIRPDALRRGKRRQARRLRSCGCRERQAGRDPDGHRKRGDDFASRSMRN